MRHVLTNLLSVYRSNAQKCINLQWPNCMFKWKLLKRKCWLRPLVNLKRCHFLIRWSIWLKIVANCAKRVAFNNNIKELCRHVKICRQIETAIPVYFLLPLSIYLHSVTSQYPTDSYLVLSCPVYSVANHCEIFTFWDYVPPIAQSWQNILVGHVGRGTYIYRTFPVFYMFGSKTKMLETKFRSSSILTEKWMIAI